MLKTQIIQFLVQPDYKSCPRADLSPNLIAWLFLFSYQVSSQPTWSPSSSCGKVPRIHEFHALPPRLTPNQSDLAVIVFYVFFRVGMGRNSLLSPGHVRRGPNLTSATRCRPLVAHRPHAISQPETLLALGGAHRPGLGSPATGYDAFADPFHRRPRSIQGAATGIAGAGLGHGCLCQRGLLDGCGPFPLLRTCLVPRGGGYLLSCEI